MPKHSLAFDLHPDLSAGQKADSGPSTRRSADLKLVFGVETMIDRRAMEEDFYKILGVERSASQKEIQKAYRTLARKYHPDRVDDAEKEKAKARFQKIQEAYDVLNDPEKRKLYDQFGPGFRQMGGGGGGEPFQGFRGGSEGGFDFGDLFGAPGGGGFEDLFGQFTGQPRGGRRAPRKGRDLETELAIPFKTAILGGSYPITLDRGGRMETIQVTIPAGIEDGRRMRLAGQGEPSRGGGAAGDLLLTLKVLPHPHFRRQGDTLSVTLPVTLEEAALGGKIDVPTPTGTISLKIPPGSSTGKKLRVKGHGVAASGRPAGDLFVELSVTLPDRYDEATQEAIRALQRRLGQEGVRRELGW